MRRFWHRLRGVSNLKDAWFLGVIYRYFGIPLPSFVPLSDKAMLLFGSWFILNSVIYQYYLSERISLLLFDLSVLTSMLICKVIALTKTYWMKKEEAEELLRRAKSRK
jgi:hypothetical protein